MSDANVESHAPTALGWFARIVSVLLVAGLAGVLIWKISAEDEPIRFSTEVKAEDIRQENGQYFIPVTVTNEGSRTAQMVVMTLSVGGQDTDVEIDMIGADESTKFIVGRPARFDTVTHSVVSYEAP